MSSRSRPTWMAAVLLGIASAAAASGVAPIVPEPVPTDAAVGDSGASTPPAALVPAWETLRYEAKNAFGRVGGEIALRATSDSAEAWVADARTWFRPRLLRDKGSERQTWFDPGDGAVERATRITTGPGPDKKIYRFTREGAHRVRIEPRPSEESLPPAQWSQVRESFHELATGAQGCAVVSAPEALLAGVSAAVAAGEAPPTGACVFLGKTFFRVAFRPAGLEQIDVNYRLRGARGKRKGRAPARRVDVHAWPVAGELDIEEPFDLVLLVEEESGLPLRIRTPIAGFGEMDIALAEATLF